MNLVRLAVSLLAVAFVAGQYFQERRRLAQIEQMAPREAQVFYEKHRRQTERFLTLFSIGFCITAAAALTYSYVGLDPR